MIHQQQHELFLLQNSIVLTPKQCERVLVLLEGKVSVKVNGQSWCKQRSSFFDGLGSCWTISLNQLIQVELAPNSFVLLIEKANQNPFGIHYFQAQTVLGGEGVWNNSAKRYVKTYFDYDNAPFSSLVVGEVVNSSGGWTSYLPHNHAQPETYFFVFNHQHGFGFQALDQQVQTVYHHSVVPIPPYVYHPNVGAPGYLMGYVWVISHLKEQPWKKDRFFHPNHLWLNQKDGKS